MTRRPAPDEPPAAPPDGGSLAEAYLSVARRLRQLGHASVAPLGVTPAQARALGVLHRHGAMRARDLSDHLHIAPRSVTEVVDALEARALVERSPDPDDRRATRLELTDEGRRTADALRAARLAEGEALFGSLSPADREHLSRILSVLREPAR